MLNHCQLTVSRLFLPLISTVSPRKSCNSSILVCERNVKQKVKIQWQAGKIYLTIKIQRTSQEIKTNTIRTCDMETTELSSLMASSTNKRFGRDLFFKIAVASSSLWKRVNRKLGPVHVTIQFSPGTKMKSSTQKEEWKFEIVHVYP